jgi:hypothetical protein
VLAQAPRGERRLPSAAQAVVALVPQVLVMRGRGRGPAHAMQSWQRAAWTGVEVEVVGAGCPTAHLGGPRQAPDGGWQSTVKKWVAIERWRQRSRVWLAGWRRVLVWVWKGMVHRGRQGAGGSAAWSSRLAVVRMVRAALPSVAQEPLRLAGWGQVAELHRVREAERGEKMTDNG